MGSSSIVQTTEKVWIKDFQPFTQKSEVDTIIKNQMIMKQSKLNPEDLQWKNNGGYFEFYDIKKDFKN